MNFDFKIQKDWTVCLCNKKDNSAMVLKLAFENRSKQSLMVELHVQKKWAFERGWIQGI
jgi:hypothetical protein